MILSLRAYAAHRKHAGLPGGTDGAVRRAIKEGRLSKRVLTGDGKIRSARAADLEWLASTKADMVPLTGPTAPRIKSRMKTARNDKKARQRRARTTETDEADARIDPEPVNELGAARARREAAAADMAEIEVAEKRGELVLSKDVEARLADYILKCRARLLGIPGRLREASPHLAANDIDAVEVLIHEALEELAHGGSTT